MLLVIIWAALGPAFHYSDSWQLVINTGTTIVTFLMVFLIQNSQNRDARAIHLKLDELLRGVKGARTGLLDLESLSDKELDSLQGQFHALRGRHCRVVGEGIAATEDQMDDGRDRRERTASPDDPGRERDGLGRPPSPGAQTLAGPSRARPARP